METKSSKKQFWKTVVVTLIFFFAYKIITTLLGKVITDGITFIIIREFFILLAGLGAAAVLKRLYTLKLTGKYFGTGVLVGLWFIVVPILELIIFSSRISITTSALGVILFTISMVFVAVGEELLFRGILLNGCLDLYGEDSVKSIRRAVIVSGLIFGCLHIFNVVSGSPLISSIIQGICNIPSGMLFGVVYVRSRKNLWPGVLCHFFLDFASFITSGILGGASMNDSLNKNIGLNSFGPALIILVIVFIVMRKKKIQELVVAPAQETEG